MAQRVEHFSLLVPAGTPRSSPRETPLTFAAGITERIDVTIPAGHAGLTGIGIFFGAGTQVVPSPGRVYLSGQSKTYSFPVDDLPEGTSWLAVMYNDDVYDHTFSVDFLVNEIVADDLAGLPIIFLPYAELG